MRVLVLFAVVFGIAAADLPSSSYGVPNGGSGASNGASGNGFGSSTNGFGSTSNGFGSASNGFGSASNGFGSAINGFGGPSNGYGYGQDDELVALSENIPGGGVPGEDYPILASVPDTGFSCDAQAVPGYYADTAPEAGCQVFHICQDRALRRQKDSFLCPNGTIFNQQYLVCDWWFNFDCSQAESFYSVNELIGVVPDAGYAYGGPVNGNGNGVNGRRNGNGSNGNGNNGNGSNGYSSNGNGSNGNGNGSGSNGANGNGSNGYSSNGNGNGNGSNGSGVNGNGSNGNGVSNGNGNGSPVAPSYSYGAPF